MRCCSSSGNRSTRLSNNVRASAHCPVSHKVLARLDMASRWSGSTDKASRYASMAPARSLSPNKQTYSQAIPQYKHALLLRSCSRFKQHRQAALAQRADEIFHRPQVRAVFQDCVGFAENATDCKPMNEPLPKLISITAMAIGKQLLLKPSQKCQPQTRPPSKWQPSQDLKCVH